MEKHYTIAQLADETGIPHQTIRRYIDKHGHHLKTRKKHKSVLIAEESIKTLEKIRLLYGDRLTVEEVDNALSEQGIPVTIAVPTDDEKMVKMDLGAVMTLVGEQLETMNERLKKQESHMDKQGTEIEELKTLLKMQIERHDQLVTTTMRNHLETQKQIAAAASEVKKKWWEFWK